MSFSSIFNFFKKSDTSVIGIDVGASSIKIIQLKKKKGRAILETYGELALGPYGGVEIGRATNLPTSKIVEGLVDLLKESHTTTKRCGIAIPLSSSLVTFIKMPALSNKELVQMIPIEARKYIPVPINEVSLDWWIVPKEDKMVSGSINEEQPKNPEKESVDVLVVVIHNEAIEKYREITSQASLESSFFEIEIFSTIRAALEQGIEAQMVLDMGAGTTKLYIVERGILKNSHTINRGSQDITLAISKGMGIGVNEAENLKRTIGLSDKPEDKALNEVISLTLDYIFYEANRVLLNYQKKYNKDISKVVLTGGGVLLTGFAELAKKSFQTEIVTADPFDKVETPAFLSNVLKNAGPEFTVALGVALRKLSELE
ncbi:MAG: type IV pilus assembly protein PilM [Candidatus Taylorbacteria bacterium]|nr:type IV pilus assembly protein PilM [Candidatus Taylorbacteria bacterium]